MESFHQQNLRILDYLQIEHHWKYLICCFQMVRMLNTAMVEFVVAHVQPVQLYQRAVDLLVNVDIVAVA